MNISFSFRYNQAICHVNVEDNIYVMYDTFFKHSGKPKRFRIIELCLDPCHRYLQYCFMKDDPNIGYNWSNANDDFSRLFLKNYKGWDFDTELEKIIGG